MFTQKHLKELIKVIAGIKNEKFLEAFLSDLLTPQELSEVTRRWQIIKQLHKGTPQRTIAKNINVSISKITRGSRMLLNKTGGFNQILRLKK